jgi:tRNA-specific 2-thiouridylase
LTSLSNGYAHFVFDVSPRDITPGQAAVFYEGEVVLGGGIIQPQSILSHPQSTI